MLSVPETPETSPSGSLDQLESVSRISGIPHIPSIDSLAGSARPSTSKEPRQKGFLHFVVDFFPVVAEKIVHPERVKDVASKRKSTTIVELPPEGEEGVDEEVKQERLRKAEEEARKREEEAEEEKRLQEERQERISGILKEFRKSAVGPRLLNGDSLF